MQKSKIMLFDSDEYTRSILIRDLAAHGFDHPIVILNTENLPNVLEDSNLDIMIFNYHYHQSDSLNLCSSIKSLQPNTSIIAIVSPGPALKAVRLWAKQTKSIDVIIEKPLSAEQFFKMLTDLLINKEAERMLEGKAKRLANLIPEVALSTLERSSNNDAELFEATVLFTDIRRSTKLITEMAPREYFDLLNKILSLQTKYIKQFEGSVIKYTGDGLMAIFKGMGRSYLGLRCALELARNAQDTKLQFGIGVAQGIVLAGFIGDSHQSGQRMQYDVIGATVHLASRLCAIADAGEVITTKSVNAVAKLSTPTPKSIGGIPVRGFERNIDCVSFNLSRIES